MQTELVLEWVCETCGWRYVVETPGFAGDGRFHYKQPNNQQCGPIKAQRVSNDYMRGFEAGRSVGLVDAIYKEIQESGEL